MPRTQNYGQAPRLRVRHISIARRYTYRLVCTKNQASHERRLRQRRCDLEAVAELTA